MNRRQVLRWISLFGLGLTEFTLPGPFVQAQTDKSRKKARPGYALVGCGHQGLNLLEQIIRSDCADVKYLCDVDPAHLNAARRLFESHQSPPTPVADFRTLLGSKSIDAFIIATPNHWHTPMAISAMKAGHDVYLEKPVSHSYEETLKLLDVQKQTGRKVQVGTNLRSSSTIRQGVELCQKRPLQDIQRIVLRIHKPTAALHPPPMVNAIDWDLWSGPSLLYPRRQESPHYFWHFDWEYGEGHFSNFGIHLFDLLMWITKFDQESRPNAKIEIATYGNRLAVKDPGQTPNILFAEIKLGDLQVYCELITTPQIIPLKKQLTLTVHYKDENIKFDLDGRYSVHKKAKGDHFRSSIDMGKHILNFSQSLKGHEELNAPLRLGLLSTQMIHYLNYCYRSSASENLLTKNALLQKLNRFAAPLKTRSPFALSAVEKLLPADATFLTNKIHFDLNDLTHFQPDVNLLRNHYRAGWLT